MGRSFLVSTQIDDRQYFTLREQQVRALSEQAKDPAVRAIHAELARLYALRAREERAA